MIEWMDADEAERVVLELSPGEPISGRISLEGREAESFRGWVDLASRLERLRNDARIDASGPEGWEPVRETETKQHRESS
jgi:hypothetical protein